MRNIVTLLDYQKEALEKTKGRQRVAYYLDMGLGKTFVASEKLREFKTRLTLIVCQKSKISDWVEHFKVNYGEDALAYKKGSVIPDRGIIVINYDSIWRRPELQTLREFTLILDESQYIKNSMSKRSKFIMKLKPENIILLSGTPVGGKYEELWTQCKLLGWNITKGDYLDRYVITKQFMINGFPVEQIIGYRRVEELKTKLRQHGAIFMKSDEVLSLPEQNEYTLKIKNTPLYREFDRHGIIEKKDLFMLGDTAFNKLLGLRQLCGSHNQHKLDKVADLIESTNDRLIIFYNFKAEYDALRSMIESKNRKISVVNGSKTDLAHYENTSDSVTLIQYQSGASGLNLQLANKIIYFSLPLSSELFEQSKKRIHRLGQKKACFYYYLIVQNSIEERIHETLKKRKDFTDKLFEVTT